MMAAFGITFELPVLLVFLQVAGVVTPSRSRRGADGRLWPGRLCRHHHAELGSLLDVGSGLAPLVFYELSIVVGTPDPPITVDDPVTLGASRPPSIAGSRRWPAKDPRSPERPVVPPADQSSGAPSDPRMVVVPRRRVAAGGAELRSGTFRSVILLNRSWGHRVGRTGPSFEYRARS